MAKVFKCKKCGEEVPGNSPSVLLGHYKEQHPRSRGAKRSGGRRARTPDVDPAVAEHERKVAAETELVTNSVAWFEDAKLEREAYERVINYLRDRYAPSIAIIGELLPARQAPALAP